MNKINRLTTGKTGSILSATLLLVLTGCVGYVEEPRRERAYAPPPRAYVEPQVVAVQDDYVYFPEYEVYYSSTRRQYVYQDGGSWVTRPNPRVAVNVLFATPSVRMDFHDSPAQHHATVVRQHPKHGQGHDENRDQDKHDNGKGHDR